MHLKSADRMANSVSVLWLFPIGDDYTSTFTPKRSSIDKSSSFQCASITKDANLGKKISALSQKVELFHTDLLHFSQKDRNFFFRTSQSERNWV